jgi:hypothetical protein
MRPKFGLMKCDVTRSCMTLCWLQPQARDLDLSRIRSISYRRMMSHDFDFFAGSWKVTHRRLKERLTGSTKWEEFEGTTSATLLMDGAANVDDNLLHLPGGSYRAVTLRSYDPASGQWSIWWLDGRNPHALDTPVRGSFVNGKGVFLADDTLHGNPIRVRFIWSDIKKDSAHWEQAFSPDGGETWETNWTMDFARY